MTAMVGFFEIVIALLVLCLIYKGIEIFQNAYVSQSPNRSNGLAIGAISIAVAVALGVVAIWLTETQAAKVAADIPRFR